MKNPQIKQTERTLDVICMGRVAVDLYAEQIHSSLSEAQSFRKYLGGCAGNIAVGTSRMDLNSALFSKVGSDEMGKFLLETLKREGVNCHLVSQTPDHLTGLVLLGVIPPEHFPLMFYRENCADMQLQHDDCDFEFFQKSHAFLVTGTGFSTESMQKTSHQALKLAKSAGCKIIFDLDYRPVLWGLTSRGDGESRYKSSTQVTKEYQKVLESCDLIVGTDEEFNIATGLEDIDKSIQNVRENSNAIIVLKLGGAGCKIFDPSMKEPIYIAGFPVSVLNVLGAGDAFLSGFLRGWLKNHTWEECGRFANAAGAIVVSRHGCSPAIPTFEEMLYFISQHETKVKQVNLNDPKYKLLHRRATFGKSDRKPLYMLAFDHRSQFEQSCHTLGKNLDHIKIFKHKIYEGFLLASKKISKHQSNLALLVDPIYGKDIIRDANSAELCLAIPIEAAQSLPVEWIEKTSLYQQILSTPSNFIVKILWQFQPDFDNTLKQQQLHQLQRLHEVCHDLDRKLMVELISNDIPMAMREVYQHHVYPYWWKIEAADSKEQWHEITSIADNYDSESRFVILGGEISDLTSLEQKFRLARSQNHVMGFAVGRGIFWSAWEDYINGKVSIDSIAERTARNYITLIEYWEGSKEQDKTLEQESNYERTHH